MNYEKWQNLDFFFKGTYVGSVASLLSGQTGSTSKLLFWMLIGSSLFFLSAGFGFWTITFVRSCSFIILGSGTHKVVLVHDDQQMISYLSSHQCFYMVLLEWPVYNLKQNNYPSVEYFAGVGYENHLLFLQRAKTKEVFVHVFRKLLLN